jgi:regulator of protease activity HflC (stomatin/prohibitin superfamily)
MIREVPRRALPGILLLVLEIVALGLTVWLFATSAQAQNPRGILGAAALFIIEVLALPGFMVVNPNEAKVLTLFGRYAGTVREAGLWWANPFLTKKRISLRVRNFETAKLKVNDKNSNPIEIATIVVWKVVDTAEAMLEVDDYQNYVQVQCESALRAMATGYPYDAHEEGEFSLSAHPIEVSKGLQTEIQERLGKAGVQVIEARISHLAYAPEIAAAMLQRQQASAIIAARQKIVEGAVGMVDMAISMLSQKEIVHLDEERKATMVSNLMVVLCSERGTQPVLNTGSLYT